MLYRNENRWDEIVMQVSASVGDVEPALVKAVIGCESSFAWLGDTRNGEVIDHPSDIDRYESHLNTYSVGPMQVLPATASWFAGRTITREALWDPWTCIFYGASYLSAAVNGWRPGKGGTRVYGHPKARDVRQAAAWYNGGFWVKEPWPSSVQRYAECVAKNYTYFRDVAIANAVQAPSIDNILGIPVVTPDQMGPVDVWINVPGSGTPAPSAAIPDPWTIPPGYDPTLVSEPMLPEDAPVYAPDPRIRPRPEPADTSIWALLLIGAAALLFSQRKR